VVNDKQWQNNSDGWVTAMNKSKEKKQAKREQDYNTAHGICDHGDTEWCDTCAYDINGEQVAVKGIDYE
jgi:hypothetical protein